jgi:hypothetical protein
MDYFEQCRLNSFSMTRTDHARRSLSSISRQPPLEANSVVVRNEKERRKTLLWLTDSLRNWLHEYLPKAACNKRKKSSKDEPIHRATNEIYLIRTMRSTWIADITKITGNMLNLPKNILRKVRTITGRSTFHSELMTNQNISGIRKIKLNSWCSLRFGSDNHHAPKIQN